MRLLAETPDLIVVDKPTGLASARLATKPANPSVEAEVSERFGEAWRLLHRLDTGTSGCLAFARDEAFERVRAAWKTEAVRKLYRARISRPHGLPPAPFEIRHPIARLEKTKKRLKAIIRDSYRVGIRGEPLPAHTLVRAIANVARDQCELEIEIFTGVMHQIRVHLSAMGSPLVGDAVYGGPAAERLYLHAERLVIAVPGLDPVDVDCPPPWA